MIKLLDTTIIGFGSIIGPVTYRLDRPGLNIIQGKNGAGKSSILNAISWALFGKLLKKGSSINPWPWIIDKDYKGTKVKVRYRKDGLNHTIIHCNEYKEEVYGEKGKNRLIILVGGKVREDLRDKDDAKKWIINNLGYTFELFKNTLVFGQKVKRIIEEDGPVRNKVLEEAFEISYITLAKIKTDQILRDSKPVLQSLAAELAAREILIDTYKDHLKTIEEARMNFRNDRANTILKYRGTIKEANRKAGLLRRKYRNLKKELKTKIKDKKAEIDKFYLIPEKLKKLGKREFDLMLTLTRKNDQIEGYDKEIQILKNQFTKVPRECNTCKRPFSKEQVIEQKKKIASDRVALVKLRKKATKSRDETQTRYDIVLSDIASLNKTQEKVTPLKYQLKVLETQQHELRDIKYDLKQCAATVETYESLMAEEKAKKFKDKSQRILTKLEHTQAKLVNIKQRYEEVKEEIEIAEWLIKDPLSNSGIKAYIFDNMLSITNRELAKYENLLGYRIKISISLETKRKDFNIQIYKNGNEIPHKDLSGGQAQLGDVCIAFAIHETVAENKGCNVLLLDEVFESLDEDNIEKIGDIIAFKARSKSIHLITHNKSFSPVNAHYTYIKYKKPGITKVSSAA